MAGAAAAASAASSSGQAAKASKSMDWGAIGNYASAGIDILQGIGKWAYAGDIGREKKKLLDSRANYNRKEIERAFKKNYSIQMSQYAQQLSDLSLQKIQAENQILQQATQGIGDIDIQGSSFKDLAFSTLKGEFNSELNKLIDDNMNANITLASKAIEQERQVNLGQKLGHIQINAETDQMKTEGIGQVISGLTLGINTAVQKKADELEKEESDKRMEQMIQNNALYVPDYNDKYFTRQIDSWQLTKRKNPSILSGLSNDLSFSNYGRSAMSTYY